MDLIFRSLITDDWQNVASIYLEGIRTGHATFQTVVPSWEKWDSDHLKSCRIIADCAGEMAGWAALSPVSGRCVYAGVAEVSIYLAEKFRGQKIGTLLLQKLIEESERNGIWTLQSGIFPENRASIALHEKLGFRIVGYREEIGEMDGVWRDTVLMERRSKVTGIGQDNT
jgi:L-amino acid N-acyltransferase YncA